MPEAEEEEEASSGAGLSPEIVASYLSFAKRSVRARWLLSLVVLVLGLGFTLALVVFLPRTYSCTTVLMPVGNPVLDGRDIGQPFAGASDLILRHENLENLIHELDLIEKQEERRPRLLKLKDKIMRLVSSEPSQEVKIGSLVGTMENRIDVSTDKGDLTIKVDWSDAKTAQELAETAREDYLKTRRTAEISAFEEKMEILDGHSKKLREEIADLAGQLDAARAAQIKQAREEQAALKAGNAAAAAAAAPVRIALPRPVKHSSEPDPNIALLKDKLDAAKRKLADLEADRERKLRDAQNKFEELKLHLTASHPEVITQGERVAMLEQVPSDVALLRAEVKDLDSEIRQGEALARSAGAAQPAAGGGMMMAAPGPAATNDTLPPEITDLLTRNDLDPALSAQLSGAVMKYGALRDDILSARIQLDTAQAAFARRYQVIIPAEVPSKASKPKPAIIVGGGAFVSLLLALMLPILAQLRRGVMIELWQVQQINLPVLAELKLPPHSGD